MTDAAAAHAPAAAASRSLAQDLARAERSNRLRALLLVAPLAAFLVVTFALPILAMLTRGVHSPLLSDLMPATMTALADWPGDAPPSEAAYAALAQDLIALRREGTAARAATRLNFEQSGFRSLIMSAARMAEQRSAGTGWREAFVAADPRWGETATWGTIAYVGQRITPAFYLAALDAKRMADGAIAAQPEENRVYVMLFLRTLWIAAAVTGLCLLLGFPLSYVLAHLPPATANLLMIAVLLPFWTSLLVRTTSWIVLLQSNGVVNDTLVWLGLVADGARLPLIHNQFGTLIAMTHILLPFAVLPLYAVMRTIPPSLARAARSLGAGAWTAFWRVYFPQTLPGVGAGALLVFILALGYYITPALVGGRTGQLISNMIAYHMQSSLNWGLAAALSGLLLAGVLALFFVYQRLLGPDRLRFA